MLFDSEDIILSTYLALGNKIVWNFWKKMFSVLIFLNTMKPKNCISIPVHRRIKNRDIAIILNRKNNLNVFSSIHLHHVEISSFASY